MKDTIKKHPRMAIAVAIIIAAAALVLVFGLMANRAGSRVRFRQLVEPSLDFDEVWYCHEGLVSVEKGQKFGFATKTGELAIPCIYDESYGFHDGLAGVKKDGKWGVIDKNNNIILPFEYDDLRMFTMESLCWAQKDGKWGVFEWNS